MKVVISQRYGGFSLSEKAMKRLRELGWIYDNRPSDRVRHDPALVQVVEELGSEANGSCANLIVKEFDDKYMGYYYVHEYDGYESLEVDWERVCEKVAEDLTLENTIAWKEKLQSMRVGRGQ